MYLPEDLVREILLKLRSTKSAVRLSSVCKLWRDLILRNPGFCDKLFNKNDDPILLFRRHEHDKRGEYQIRTRNSCVNLSFPGGIQLLREIGSCNGVLCLIESVTKVFTRVNLYNPITREYRKIDNPCANVLCYGFGYDSTSCDYKAVRIKKKVAEVYKLSTNRWIELEVDLIKHVFGDFSDPFVYHKGRCFWKSYSRIVAFDFRTETFSFLALPDAAALRSYDLGVLDNSLVVCIPKPPDKNGTDIWERLEDGKNWVKWFSIKQDIVARVDFGACWVEDKTLFQLNSDGEVVALEKHGRREVRSRLFRFDSPMYSITFKPSLVSLARQRLLIFLAFFKLKWFDRYLIIYVLCLLHFPFGSELQFTDSIDNGFW